MESTCRRCGARATDGRCTLCGSNLVFEAPDLPSSPRAEAPAHPYGIAANPPPAAPTPGSPRSRQPWILGAIGVVAAVGVVGGILSTSTGTADIGTPAVNAAPHTSMSEPPVATNATAAALTPTASSTSPEQTEAAALNNLASLASSGGARASKNGQWVAQLASKWVGVEDTRLTTASGSHVFYAVDILHEHQQLRERFSSYDVVLLDSRTYGKRLNRNGQAIWVTSVVNQGFSDEDAVLYWCRGAYPGLSGKDLLNSCMPNRLNP